MKKKMMSMCLALSLVFALAIPAGATVEGSINTDYKEVVLELEYMDFYENQEYYMSLVCDKNYTLHFDLNDEYRELEQARLAESVSAVDEMQPSMTRGTSVPTQAHDIRKGKLSFAGEAVYSDLYTNYYCIGSSWYVVSLINDDADYRPLRVTAYNVLSSQTTTSFPAGGTIKKYTMTGTGATAPSKHFYLRFSAPVNVSGTIERYTG